jgi:sphinganine-1-phosphate aldolase
MLFLLFCADFALLWSCQIEVVKMTAKMLNAGDEAVGSLTCGGTESILMAIKAYKELAIQRGISEPEIVCPVSAHAAFAKVCFIFQCLACAV